MKRWPGWGALRLPVLLSIAWCLFMLALYQRGSMEKDAHTNELALIQTRTLFTQILDTRAWNAAHGGVYVPESAYGEPNPWIPADQRTLRLSDGTRLVLMNPAYMSRQIGERSSMRGASFRITSHSPLRPQNASDLWETQALTRCMQGAPEVFDMVEGEDGPRFRYMNALRTEKSCLGCHGDNREGDVRGGISVNLDAGPFLQAAREQTKSLVWAFGLMGFTGVGSIWGISALAYRRRMLAQERERMKSAFLANMSHDMRTPLTGILGMAELLERAADGEGRRHALAYLRVAGGALLEMVNDITGYAALDAGGITLVQRSFVLPETLACCLNLFRPQCEARNLELTLHLAQDVPRVLYGDDFRLRQVLGNLISNSAKFTVRGGIRLEVSLAQPAQEKGVAVRFAVRDTGMGIASEEQVRIFGRFERGAAARRQGTQGTGLGLSIAQEIVQLMGGKLEVQSTPGQGACFFFTARFAAKPGPGVCCEPGSPAEQAAPPVSAPADEPGETIHAASVLAGASVLLVEDNAAAAHFMEQVLLQAGCAVRMAADGESALRLLEQAPADMVLLDVRMPGMDGLELARRIRASAWSKALPMAVLSASASLDERKAFLALGVETYLLKPVAARELARVVEAALRGKAPKGADRAFGCGGHGGSVCRPGSATAHAAHNSTEYQGGDDPAVCDLPAALADMDGDAGLLAHLAALWLDEAPRQRAALHAALHAEDSAAVRRVAHAWKNSAAILHLEETRSVCALLESAPQAQWPVLLPELERADAASRQRLRQWLARTARTDT